MSMDRDKFLAFSEAEHSYIYLPTGENYISATTFLHSFFPKFDGPMVVDKMMASRNWPQSKYYDMTKDQILTLWENERNTAAAKGTLMHSRIENELLAQDVDWSGQERERNNFRSALEELTKQGWKPFRLEWRIFTEIRKVAGTLDGLFINDKGEYLLLDWKCCKEIKSDNPWQRALAPLNHLPDCNLIHYHLQLNLYRWILKQHYNIMVKEMRLYSFHPSVDHYLQFNVPLMEVEIEKIIRI